jgi:hypothetical protein
MTYTFGDFLPNRGGGGLVSSKMPGVSSTMPVGDRVPMDAGEFRELPRGPFDMRVQPVPFEGSGQGPMLSGAPQAQPPGPMSTAAVGPDGSGWTQAWGQPRQPMPAPQPAQRPMAGISTRREPQGWGAWGAFGVPWTFGAFAPSRGSQLASQLPMGRASATGSIPFMRNGGVR